MKAIVKTSDGEVVKIDRVTKVYTNQPENFSCSAVQIIEGETVHVNYRFLRPISTAVTRNAEEMADLMKSIKEANARARK